MNRRYRYAREKFATAIECLATGPGDVRSRLELAYKSIWSLSNEQVPPEFQDDLKWILNNLRKHPTRKAFDGTILEGTVQHTLSRMKNKTGVKIADKIFFIGWTLITSKEYGVLY